MKLVRMAALLGVAAVLAIGAVACGDDDDDGDDNGGDANTPAATEPAAAATEAEEDTPAAGDETPADGAGGETIDVTAAGFAFDPDSITVTAGEEVTIAVDNGDAVPHTLTVYEDDTFTTAIDGADTGNIPGGASGEFTTTFDTAGEHAFRCEVHPTQMSGTLTVN